MADTLTHAGTEVGSVHLVTPDLQRALQFYTEVVGLRVLNQYGGLTRLTADGTNPIVVLEASSEAVIVPQRTTSGLYHFAILVPTRRDLGMVLRHLIEQRIGVGSADHHVSEALYISDPDGNGIEIYWDRAREAWRPLPDGQVYMSADPLNAPDLMRASESALWQGLPVGTKMGHVHLHVKNLAASEKFYCGLLGFQVRLRYGPSALFIAAGGYHHHIGLNTWAGENAPSPAPNAAGMSYFTIVNPDPGHIEKILLWLEELGVPVETKGDGWYFKDPSGIGIRLTTCPIL